MVVGVIGPIVRRMGEDITVVYAHEGGVVPQLCPADEGGGVGNGQCRRNGGALGCAHFWVDALGGEPIESEANRSVSQEQGDLSTYLRWEAKREDETDR